MNTTDKVSHFAHEAVDKITSAGNQAQDEYQEKKEQFMDAEKKMVKNCRIYVRDNPITSLGIAVASGFILSRLLSGR